MMIHAGLQAFSSVDSGILGPGSPVKLPLIGVSVPSTALLETLAVLALGALWFLLFAAVLNATAPKDITPLPAGADLGDDPPPAVVSLLANRWRLNEDAAESTLIDLAARRWIEFRQPGNDPTHTTVHLIDHPGGRPVREQQALAPYEEQVLAHVRSSAVDKVVPVTALTFRDPGHAQVWNNRLHKSVIDHARSLGLSRRRFSPALVTLLSLAAVLPAGLLALVIMERSGEIGGGPGAGLIAWGVLSGLAGRPMGGRGTPQGQEVAARWLGLRSFLRNDEAFAELPPSAVAVWDRYLSYGDALGVTRVCSALLDLGMGDRKRVWSSYGGAWHRVRVRYPKFWGRYGAGVPRVLIGAAGTLVVGWFLLKSFAAQGFDSPDSVNRLVGEIPLLLGLYLVIRGLYRVARLAADLISPRTVTGEVLWIELWKSTAERENKPSVPIVHYFAVDDGTDDRTTAWACPSEWAARSRPGDVVTFSVRPWTRRLTSLEVVSSRAARLADAAGVPTPVAGAASSAAAVTAADPAGSGSSAGSAGGTVAGGPAAAGGPATGGPATGGAATGGAATRGAAAGAAAAGPLGVLGAAVPGLGGILAGAGGPDLSPVLAAAAVDSAVAEAQGQGLPAVPQLVSVDEVAAALGRPVVSDGANARVQLGPFELVTFSEPGGSKPLLVVSVARGSAVSLVMRGLRRGGTPLPGVGDEAYLGSTWVLGRVDETLIRINLEAGAGAGQALPGLLATALSRI
jgi:hypothetical protein